MKPRRLIDRDVTSNGETVELLFEGGHYVIRINGAALMSSAMYGSEQAMATIAAERLGKQKGARVLVGGLGLGFTLRAALDSFASDAEVTVAELLPSIVRFHRSELAQATGHPLDDPRVTVFEGDVRHCLARGGWDAVLMDTDNGPEAFTVEQNADLYSEEGVKRLAHSLNPGGVVVVWSAFPGPSFERRLRRQGFAVETHRVRARASGKGPRHTLFVGLARRV